jgi:hypothetical protein
LVRWRAKTAAHEQPHAALPSTTRLPVFDMVKKTLSSLIPVTEFLESMTYRAEKTPLKK